MLSSHLPTTWATRKGVLASKYLLVTTIEDALAVANHIIASEGYRSPADYADALRVRGERGILEAALGRRLEAMARFRNLLIHVYGQVDDERVHRYLREDLADLDAFAAAVLTAFPELGQGEGSSEQD
ncbi:MAG: type VII toxin-antitoxin system HepT family RNase toxin [Gemmatimonadota bacterium]